MVSIPQPKQPSPDRRTGNSMLTSNRIPDSNWDMPSELELEKGPRRRKDFPTTSPTTITTSQRSPSLTPDADSKEQPASPLKKSATKKPTSPSTSDSPTSSTSPTRPKQTSAVEQVSNDNHENERKGSLKSSQDQELKRPKVTIVYKKPSSVVKNNNSIFSSSPDDIPPQQSEMMFKDFEEFWSFTVQKSFKSSIFNKNRHPKAPALEANPKFLEILQEVNSFSPRIPEWWVPTPKDIENLNKLFEEKIKTLYMKYKNEKLEIGAPSHQYSPFSSSGAAETGTTLIIEKENESEQTNHEVQTESSILKELSLQVPGKMIHKYAANINPPSPSQIPKPQFVLS